MKLLAPAGNFESLKMAVYNGADEVYLGINEFNARNNIDGFTVENLKSAVDFAHIFGVKVHMAINILFTDDELQRALDVVVESYNMGVDAFIIQDLGLAKIINDFYPEIEKHASTQMGIHNLEGVNAILPYGFKRVVLSRETPLEEIRRIKKNANVEIEYFAHGALCVCFSGNCYLSSYQFNASGNRGRCKQPCRLPYTLLDGDKAVKSGYLLSAKDFDMHKRLKDLEEAGVDALKIEGRARRPYYVAVATREYKRALNGKNVDVEQLKLAFNRGFTEGYFNGNGKIISEIQSHVGVEVGKVYKVNTGKKFNEVFFTSSKKLSQKSVLKTFLSGVENAVVSAYDLKEVGQDKYRLTTTRKINAGETVRLISDVEKEEEISKICQKVPVKISVALLPNKKIIAKVYLNDKTLLIEGERLQEAVNRPLSSEEIIDNFKKNEYFVPEVAVDIKGDCFMAKQMLNAFRREVYKTIFDAITKPYERNLDKKRIDYHGISQPFYNFCIIERLGEKFTAQNIIYSPEEYEEQDILAFKKRCNNEGKIAYLDTPNFATEKDIQQLQDIVAKSGIGVVANNYYALKFGVPTVIGAGLNVFNSVCASVYGKPFITPEADFGSKTMFPFMTLKACLFKAHVGGNCANCMFKQGYRLKMDNGKILKIKRKKLEGCTFYLTD